jgi:hypothetical protein
MNARQKRTLNEIFADPVSGTIKWSAIESLLEAIGCRALEGRGSRVKFELNGVLASYRPQPDPDPHAKHYQVRDVREFLKTLGVKP